jgi:muramoyltetrapeptide carboxypeptidase
VQGEEESLAFVPGNNIDPDRIIRPPSLKPGATIGVVSPAGPADAHELEPGLKRLAEEGFRLRLGPNILSRDGYLAGKDEVRVEDLHGMFVDAEIKAVFCARGGYGSMRLLDRLDYRMIRANPKPLVGYSDITALLLAVLQRSGIVTFHGPVVRDVARKDEQNLKAMILALTANDRLDIPLDADGIVRGGKSRGPLVGGNLSLICHMVGTRYLPSLRGAILFVEDTGEPAYRLDRMLTHLRLSGHLEGLASLLAGDFEGCPDRGALKQILADVTSGLDMPVAAGLPVGHGWRNLTLPMGVEAKIDTDSGILRFIGDRVSA